MSAPPGCGSIEGGNLECMPSRGNPANSQHVVWAAWALAVLLLTTGTWHFTSPSGFASIVPTFLGSPTFWVKASGVAELAAAVLLAFRPTRRFGGWACVLLFVALFPANIKMAVDSLDGQSSMLIAWLRLPLQIPLIWWALYVARGTRVHHRFGDATDQASAGAHLRKADGARDNAP